MNFSGKIFWSADDISLKSLLEIVKRPDFPREVGVKLDRVFLSEYGYGAIDAVQNEGVPVFADVKLIEIPSKILALTKQVLEHKPFMVNVMAGSCSTGVTPGDFDEGRTPPRDVLCDFAELCRDAGTRSCAVTVLTSKTQPTVAAEFGVGTRDAVDWSGLNPAKGNASNVAVTWYAMLAEECGLTDLVCSPHEAKYLRERALVGKLTLNTPGVRLPESSRDDQNRVMSPGEALKYGADRLVIGRDLSRNGEFQENYEKIKADIAKWS